MLLICKLSVFVGYELESVLNTTKWQYFYSNSLEFIEALSNFSDWAKRCAEFYPLLSRWFGVTLCNVTWPGRVSITSTSFPWEENPTCPPLVAIFIYLQIVTLFSPTLQTAAPQRPLLHQLWMSREQRVTFLLVTYLFLRRFTRFF